MLQGTDRFRCCNIVIKILNLQKKLRIVTRPPTQPTTAKLNTADGSPMSALGMTALHLRIAEFESTHNFIICNQLPEMELIFGIDIQRKFQSPMPGTKKKLLHSKRRKFFNIYKKLSTEGNNRHS